MYYRRTNMMDRYFNESEFQYAIKLLETDPFEAKNRFDAYLNKYPTDYYARAYYVILLTRIYLFDEAEKEYNAIIEESNNDSFYAYSAKRLKGFKYNMIIAKLKLLGEKEDYPAILSILNNYPEMFSEQDHKYISYYCRSRLGLIDSAASKQNANAYRFNQTVNYSEDLFREHVKRHEADYNLDAEIPNGAIFTPDFPVDEVINEIKKHIPSDKRLFPGYFDDAYYFKYDNCGRINNHLTNYFVIICFHNSTNILTMYPVLDSRKIPYTDLNYLKEKDMNIKDDRLSQIEKFNRRFKR